MKKYMFEISTDNIFILECLIDRIKKNGYKNYGDYQILFYKNEYILQAFLYMSKNENIKDLKILLKKGIHKNHSIEIYYTEL